MFCRTERCFQLSAVPELCVKLRVTAALLVSPLGAKIFRRDLLQMSKLQNDALRGVRLVDRKSVDLFMERLQESVSKP